MDPSPNPLESQDLQRFIAKFLILASLTSSLVLVLNRVGADDPTQQNAELISADAASVPQNAFAETASDGSDEFIQENVSAAGGSEDYDSKNLTDNLALAIARQTVDLNPLGPQGSDLAVTTPDVAKVITDYTKLNQSNNALIASEVNDSKIKTEGKYTQQDIIAYFEALYEIGKDSYGEDNSKVTGLLERLKREPSREVVDGLNFLFAETEASLYNLTVPDPFLEIHKSMIASMNLQKNMFDIEGPDPMKTLLLVKNARQVTRAQATSVEKSFEKMKEKLPEIMAGATPDVSARTASLFVKTAHAIILDFDIPEEITSISSTISDWIVTALEDLGVTTQIAEYIAKLVTEVLKDVLINQIAKAVLDWVLGGGKTKFVVNWKGLLKNTANSIAGGVVSAIAPELCTGLQPIIKLTAQIPGGFNTYGGSPGIAVRCTLDQVVNNIQNFYDDFAQGGFEAYAQIIQPQNNYWGLSMMVGDMAMLQAGTKAHATNQEANAGQGFLAPKTCVDQTTETLQQGAWESDPNYISETNCMNGYCEVTMCSSNGWRTNTPGSFISSALGTAVGSDAPIQRIVNATDWSSLIGAIVGYALNRLILSPDGLATFNQTPTPVDQFALCAQQYPNTQSQEYATCIANANQVPATTGNQNTAKDQALNEANSILSSSEDTIPFVEFAVDTVGNTIIPLLDLIINSPNTSASCTTAKAEAQARRPQYASDLLTNQLALVSLQNTVANLPGVIVTIQNGTSTSPAYYMNLVAPYGTSFDAARNKGIAEGNANRLMIAMQDVQTLSLSCP